ncbi:hypothetical protein GCM10017786_36220 [Amycolatopsis deserti]|uniref:Uncharacterized protein n=1 Tax=Amycolatopsis deserti TaxID=185696 RepID=A0ABQ3J1N5_9PSEU|nr:hypothetical protein GCM10017786_36220 [Amycolatopsis deserti]
MHGSVEAAGATVIRPGAGCGVPLTVVVHALARPAAATTAAIRHLTESLPGQV